MKTYIDTEGKTIEMEVEIAKGPTYINIQNGDQTIQALAEEGQYIVRIINFFPIIFTAEAFNASFSEVIDVNYSQQ